MRMIHDPSDFLKLVNWLVQEDYTKDIEIKSECIRNSLIFRA